MELLDKKTIQQVLRQQRVPALKKFGQNFLIDKAILEKIIKAAALNKNDLVLEIGPGLGTLTKELAKNCQQVVAVEKDRRIINILKNNLKGFENIEIIEADIMKFSIFNFPFGPRPQGRRQFSIFKNYKVVANLPYNIAMPVIRKFIEAEKPPQEMTLMLQKEVAEKICSQKASLPKIAIEFYAKAKYLFKVPKSSFYPQPKVDGAVIKITDIQENIPQVDETKFFKILKAGFSQPRKTILNNLINNLEIKKTTASLLLKKAQINPQKRPQELNLANWVKLAIVFRPFL